MARTYLESQGADKLLGNCIHTWGIYRNIPKMVMSTPGFQADTGADPNDSGDVRSAGGTEAVTQGNETHQADILGNVSTVIPSDL